MLKRCCFIFGFVFLLTGLSDAVDFPEYSYEQGVGWLRLHIVPATWPDAQLRCHLEDATLASPTTSAITAVMKTTMRAHKLAENSVFTDIHASNPKGDFTSIDGLPLSNISLKWAEGEPNNLDNNEDCLAMTGAGELADVSCASVHPYFCIKRSSRICGKCPTTDNWNICDTTDQDYTLDLRTGSCYKFHRRALSWHRSAMACAAEHAHLAVINSDEEAQVLQEVFAENPRDTIIGSDYTNFAHIGYWDWNAQSEWLTVFGWSHLCVAYKIGGDEFVHDAGGWLRLRSEPATWAHAKFRCELEGGILSSPSTPGLYVEMNLESIDTVFTGIRANFPQGGFTTIDGIPLSNISAPWAHGEPNSSNYDEVCLAMTSRGELADVSCSDERPYFCFKSNAAMTKSVCGTTDEGYELEPRTGSCYKFHREGLVWVRASMVCTAEGGHLAIINSDLESQVLKELFAKNPPETHIGSETNFFVHIGILDWNHSGQFVTVFGDSLADAGFSRWNRNEPSHTDNNEFCGSITVEGLLNDVPCVTWTKAFICEITPNEN